MQTVLVYGATGSQGKAIAAGLSPHGHKVRGYSRSTEPGGDFGDKSSLDRAHEGVDKVVLVLPLEFNATRQFENAVHAVEAMKRSNASTMVYVTSTWYPDEDVGVSMLDVRRKIDALIKREGVPCVTLRPSVYLGNLLAPWTMPLILNNGVLSYPLPDGKKVAWTAWEDLGDWVAGALARPELSGSRFDIGRRPVSGAELAASFSTVLGRTVAYGCQPLADLRAGLMHGFGALAAKELGDYYAWFQDAEGEPLNFDVTASASALGQDVKSATDWVGQKPWETGRH